MLRKSKDDGEKLQLREDKGMKMSIIRTRIIKRIESKAEGKEYLKKKKKLIPVAFVYNFEFNNSSSYSHKVKIINQRSNEEYKVCYSSAGASYKSWN